MFKKDQLDALYADLQDQLGGTPDYEEILRDVHLAIAFHDAGRPLKDVDPKAVEFIKKHAPAA